MKLSIAVVNDFTHIGGAEQMILYLCRYLQSAPVSDGWNLRVITSTPGPFARAVDAIGSIPLHYIDLAGLKRHWRTPSAWQSIRRAFRQCMESESPDLFLCNSLWSAVVVSRMLKGRTIPVICALHADPTPKRRDKRLIFRWAGRWLVRSIAGWITVSDALSRKLQALGISPETIRVIPNGVPLPASSRIETGGPRRREWGMSEGNVVCAALGRLHPGKGQHLLIDAFADIAEAYPDARLVITGEEVVTGDENLQYRTRLEESVRRYGLENRIILTGFVPDAAAVIREADIVLSASFEESFGLAVLEGMAAARPVIASDAGGHADLITHGTNGFLFPVGRVDALIALWRDVLDDADLRRRVGRNARVHARRFDMKTTLSQWAVYLEQIAERKMS